MLKQNHADKNASNSLNTTIKYVGSFANGFTNSMHTPQYCTCPKTGVSWKFYLSVICVLRETDECFKGL